MSYSTPSHLTGEQRTRPARDGEMSCATTLFIALLLIPLIFGGTLFLLNEVGQAYFGTDPIALPPQLASALDRAGVGLNQSTQAGSVSQLAPSETAIGSGSATQQIGPSETPGATPTLSVTGHTTTVTFTPTASRTASPAATSTPTPSPTSTSLLLPSPTATPGAASGSCTVTFNSGYEGTVFDLINEERQAQGLAPFTTDNKLSSAARVHATDMACNDFFSHTGSDGSSVGDRVSAQGYSWSRVGENIYAGSGSYGSPRSAVEAWMDSPGHRANILDPGFTQIGVGYVYYADSTYRNYYVTVFAAPR